MGMESKLIQINNRKVEEVINSYYWGQKLTFLANIRYGEVHFWPGVSRAGPMVTESTYAAGKVGTFCDEW